MRAIAILLFAVALCRASLVPLAWTHPVPADVDGYAVWVTSGQQEPQWAMSVATLTAEITGLPAGKHRIYVTAVKGGVHSDPSNTIELDVPQPPENLHIAGAAVLETSADLQEWTPVAYYDEARLFARIRTLP